MNRTLFTVAVGQTLTQPVRLGALIGAIVLPLLQIAVDTEPRLGDELWTICLSIIAAAGVIGVETSSGAVALLFTRPIARSQFILSRWAAAAAVACGCSLAGTLAEVLLIVAREGAITAHAAVVTILSRLLIAAGIAAVFTLFSTLTPSLGDVVVWGGTNILAASLRTAGSVASVSWLTDAGTFLRNVTTPQIDLWRVLLAARTPWAELTAYAATVILSLALAVVAMNRKELTYASE